MAEGSTRNNERSVESFNNSIAELRAYGVGVVVADQSPSRVSLDVLRNVGTKIFHGIQESDDQESAASLLGFTIEDASCLASLQDRGFAFIRTRSSELKRPSIVRVHKFISRSPNEKFKLAAGPRKGTDGFEMGRMRVSLAYLLAEKSEGKIPEDLLPLVQYDRRNYGIPKYYKHNLILEKTFAPEF